MNLKKVCICGHFGFGEDLLNGQTIKTKIVAAELDRELGAEQVCKIDTHGGAKAVLRLPFQLFGAMRGFRNIIILPAHNGLRVIAPILSLYRRIFQDRKLHYIVIGGWLPSFLQDKPALQEQLKRFDALYVETNTMRGALEAMGFANVVVMPNCKELVPVAESELATAYAEPYKLCTFSRVMREKGIEDAVEAVKVVNEKFGRTVFTLDIYGQVDAGQTEWFAGLQGSFPEYIRYGGQIPFARSVEVLKDYFALLFPTKFYTEGIPGTIIDAYAAGVPVISTRWESFADMIEDGRSGIGYAFGENEELISCLCGLQASPERIINMKHYCLEKAEGYRPENVLQTLIQRL